MGFLRTFLRHFDTVAGPLVMLLYPLYASVKAIESPSALDDQQWLTYWVLYSLITLFELSCYKILVWFPIWPYLKLIVACWLVLPLFNGAAYIYQNYVRKYLLGKEPESLTMSKSQKEIYSMMSPSARAAAERYISKYGEAALENVIKAAEREAKKQKSAGGN